VDSLGRGGTFNDLHRQTKPKRNPQLDEAGVGRFHVRTNE